MMTSQELSIFYKNVSEMYGSGLHFIQVFETLAANEKNSDFRSRYVAIGRSLSASKSLTQALTSARFVPPFDLPIIHAAENSGNLQRVFENLSKRYEAIEAAERAATSGLVRPFFTLVLAFFLVPFPDLFADKITLAGYLTRTLGATGAVVFVAFYAYYLNQRCRYDQTLALSRQKLMSALPWLSGLSRKISLEKFTSTLAFTLDAGLSVFEALEHAGKSAADPQITSAARQISAAVKGGSTLPAAFRPFAAVFGPDILNSVSLGNESGRLPGFLERSNKRLNTEVQADILSLGKAISTALNWAVSLFVMWTIVRGATADVEKVNKMIDQL